MVWALVALLSGQGVYAVRGGLYAPLASYWVHAFRYTLGGDVLDPRLGTWRLSVGWVRTTSRFTQGIAWNRTGVPFSVRVFLRPPQFTAQILVQQDWVTYRYAGGAEYLARFRRWALGVYRSDLFSFQVERFAYENTLPSSQFPRRVENQMALRLENRWGEQRLVQDVFLRHVERPWDALTFYYRVAYSRPLFLGHLRTTGLVWADRYTLQGNLWARWSRRYNHDGWITLEGGESVSRNLLFHRFAVFHRSSWGKRWKYQQWVGIAIPTGGPYVRWLDGQTALWTEHRGPRTRIRAGLRLSGKMAVYPQEGLGALVRMGPEMVFQWHPSRTVETSLEMHYDRGVRFLAYTLGGSALSSFRGKLQLQWQHPQYRVLAYLSHAQGIYGEQIQTYPYAFWGWGLTVSVWHRMTAGWGGSANPVFHARQDRLYVRTWNRWRSFRWTLTASAGWSREGGILTAFQEYEVQGMARIPGGLPVDLRVWVRRQHTNLYWGGNVGTQVPFGRMGR